MTDNQRLRAFAQSLIDDAGDIVAEYGVAGGHVEVERAEIGRKLIALLDSLPVPTAPPTADEVRTFVLDACFQVANLDVGYHFGSDRLYVIADRFAKKIVESWIERARS